MSDKPKTLLGFDYGTKSIGVAVGQEVTATAKALNALKARDGIPNWDEIGKLIAEWQPDLLVIGLPLNMDSTDQEITQRAKKFANRLHGRFNLPIALHDERLSTAEAKELLFERFGYRGLKKGNIDSMSAQLILESWMGCSY